MLEMLRERSMLVVAEVRGQPALLSPNIGHLGTPH